MRVALSGWFSEQAVGSGQYADHLLEALRETAGPDEHFSRIDPARPSRSPLAKLRFEQLDFPRAAARQADLAHVPYWAPPLRPRIPLVVTVHDLIPLVLPAYRRRASSRAYTRLVALATRRADAILADSQATARDLREHLSIPSERIHVVPLGVHGSFQPAAPERVETLRSRLGLPDRYGLYLGGYELRKNLSTLVVAWARVFATTATPLVLGGKLPEGSDPMFPDPRAMARARGLPSEALVCTGFVADEDLATLYSGAAVFAFPSIYEGFGLPPLEAMACGAPTVVANATSLPEMVGDAGRLVAPRDERGWAAAIIELLEDPALAERMRRRGREQAAGFRWDETARRTRSVYRSLLDASGA